VHQIEKKDFDSIISIMIMAIMLQGNVFAAEDNGLQEQ
jgi:hypothetical protein